MTSQTAYFSRADNKVKTSITFKGSVTKFWKFTNNFSHNSCFFISYKTPMYNHIITKMCNIFNIMAVLIPLIVFEWKNQLRWYFHYYMQSIKPLVLLFNWCWWLTNHLYGLKIEHSAVYTPILWRFCNRNTVQII